MKKVFGFMIVVYDIRGRAYGRTKTLIWDGYKIEQFNRWWWYFMYRYGLELVNNPKCIVEFNQFSKEADLRKSNEIERDNIKKKITAQKALITKIQNSIKKYDEDNEKQLFRYKSEKYTNTVNRLILEKEKLELLKENL